MKQSLVVAKSTWRLVWRDPLTRLELVMLALLTLLAAIATPGSPTSGDGAVQMFAISYSVVPFALVLIIGQLSREDEIAWWSRPVPLYVVVWGRFLGLGLVGATLCGLMAVWGWLTMTVIAHLNPLGGLVWTFWLVLLALPSVVLVAILSLWLKEVLPRSHQYFAIAILSSLLIAFAEYKITLFYGFFPHLAFFNPFPGFLGLGLTEPPPLIAAPGVSGWLWLNRLWWIALAALVLLATVRHRDPYYPASRRRFFRQLMFFTAGISAILVMALGIQSFHLSPRQVASASPLTNFSCTTAHLDLQVTGHAGGLSARIHCRPTLSGTLRFSMNAGLTAHAYVGQKRLPVTHSAMLQHTLVRQWTVSQVPLHQAITVIAGGSILPVPTTLPYPPYAAGEVGQGMAFGSGHVFISNLGLALPSFLSDHTPVNLSVSGVAPNPVLTNARWDRNTHSWMGQLGTLTWTSANLSQMVKGPASFWARPDVLGDLSPQVTAYAHAYEAIAPWLKLPRHVSFVPSPLVSTPMWRTPLILYSDNHPYVRPGDAISGAAQPATFYEATLWLDHTIWSSHPHSRLAGLLTGLAAFRTHPNDQKKLTKAIATQSVPYWGHLSPQQSRQVLAAWQSLRARPIATQHADIVSQYRH